MYICSNSSGVGAVIVMVVTPLLSSIVRNGDGRTTFWLLILKYKQGCRGNGDMWVFPYGMVMGMTLSLWIFPQVGFCGYSHKNPVGMGWECVLKFYSHGYSVYKSLFG